MVYLKITENGHYVGAEAHDNPIYIKHQSRNKINVRCSEREAQGILSLDCSQIYQIEGKPAVPGAVRMASHIAQTEYEAFTSDTDDSLIEDIPEENPEGDGHVMTPSEMRIAIAGLTEQVQELSVRNSFLEDCLLEMSEVVYDA